MSINCSFLVLVLVLVLVLACQAVVINEGWYSDYFPHGIFEYEYEKIHSDISFEKCYKIGIMKRSCNRTKFLSDVIFYICA